MLVWGSYKRSKIILHQHELIFLKLIYRGANWKNFNELGSLVGLSLLIRSVVLVNASFDLLFENSSVEATPLQSAY